VKERTLSALFEGVSIVPASLGSKSGMVGALALVLEYGNRKKEGRK
jgi:hypothetical protein